MDASLGKRPENGVGAGVGPAAFAAFKEAVGDFQDEVHHQAKDTSEALASLIESIKEINADRLLMRAEINDLKAAHAAEVSALKERVTSCEAENSELRHSLKEAEEIIKTVGGLREGIENLAKAANGDRFLLHAVNSTSVRMQSELKAHKEELVRVEDMASRAHTKTLHLEGLFGEVEEKIRAISMQITEEREAKARFQASLEGVKAMTLIHRSGDLRCYGLDLVAAKLETLCHTLVENMKGK